MKKVIMFMLMSLLVACSSNPESTMSAPEGGHVGGKVMIVTVAPQKVDCVGVAPMKCLVVDDLFFYSQIKNFDFEEGYEYKLEITRTQPYLNSTIPADVSIYEYHLIKVLSKTKVEP